MRADAVYQILSKSVQACQNHSLPKLAHFLRHRIEASTGNLHASWSFSPSFCYDKQTQNTAMTLLCQKLASSV